MNLFGFCLSLHRKPHFLFPEFLKRWSFQKNFSGIWSFLYYQERWYFFFRKICSYPLDGKWKMIFLKKNTRKYDLFFKGSKKMVFSKRIALGHGLFCIICKNSIFSRKHDIFSLEEKWEVIFFKKYLGVRCFLFTRMGLTSVMTRPSADKNQR